MTKPFAELQKITHNEQITPAFLFHLQWALLLALREQGMLSHDQYRHAVMTMRKDAP